MRFKSNPVDKYCIFAVAGTNSVSFAIDFTKANTKDVLGFAVKRTYPGSGEHFIPGFKLFQGQKPDPTNQVSTETDPIQSFVWDDFTLSPDQEYTYTFYPMKGKPGELEKQSPIVIKIKTEPAFSESEHDVFFNRGVASSQAYAREFNNTSPDKLVGKKQQDAFNWLGRDLYPALLKFIGQAKKGDTLLGCFYEFNYPGVLDALKKAIDEKVNVTLIVDMKNNEHTVKGKEKTVDGKKVIEKDKVIQSSPRVANIAAIELAKIPKANIIYREANKDLIHHNKFIVYLKGETKTPTALWTGSTNITESGIFGQTNVGHWVRNGEAAQKYKEYWDLLSTDPGAKDNDTLAVKKIAFADYQSNVVALQKDTDDNIPVGVTPIFSPRDTLAMLGKYFSLIDKAKESSVITLAFGITADLKNLLLKHTNNSPISFVMLEKEDKPNPRSKTPFVSLTAKNNVYQAFGSYISTPLYEWTQETNNKILGITNFVNYIHSKFLIQDPLGNDPIVITGSANFSPPSTVGNDENMLIIRGNQRVADIYFTEFNRIFNHYYFRSIVQQLKDKSIKDEKKSYFLDNTDGWQKSYAPGLLRRKRVDMFLHMADAIILD